MPLAVGNGLEPLAQLVDVAIFVQRFDGRMPRPQSASQISSVFSRDVGTVEQHDLGNVRRRGSAEDRPAKACLEQPRQVAAVVDVRV